MRQKVIITGILSKDLFWYSFTLKVEQEGFEGQQSNSGVIDCYPMTQRGISQYLLEEDIERLL